MPIYFDHNSTTRLHPDVFHAMQPYLEEEYGNASCLYGLGVNAGYALEKARLRTARLIDASAEEIVFTSGGTESDNLALQGAVMASGKRHIITSVIEHPAVGKTCEFLEQFWGCRLTVLPVDPNGRIDPRSLCEAITPDTAVVSIMIANNETGVIQPIREMGEICRRTGVLFHTDAVQAAGRIALDVISLFVDLLSISAHKMYGPKGVGALFVRRGIALSPILHGGGHENGLRSGTENIPGIVGLGQAAVWAKQELSQRAERLRMLADHLWTRLQSMPFPVLRNSPVTDCLPGTVNVSFPGIPGRELVRALDEEGFCVASGSACSTGKTTPSYVLKAIGRSDEDAASSLRLSFGEENTMAEVDQFAEILPAVISRFQK